MENFLNENGINSYDNDEIELDDLAGYEDIEDDLGGKQSKLYVYKKSGKEKKAEKERKAKKAGIETVRKPPLREYLLISAARENGNKVKFRSKKFSTRYSFSNAARKAATFLYREIESTQNEEFFVIEIGLLGKKENTNYFVKVKKKFRVRAYTQSQKNEFKKKIIQDGVEKKLTFNLTADAKIYGPLNEYPHAEKLKNKSYFRKR